MPDVVIPRSPLFAYRQLNEIGRVKAERISLYFDKLLYSLQELCPEGREMSLVKTKLEEASFFAKKAMSLVNQEPLP